MTDKQKATLLRNAIGHMKGDDLERAQSAFRGLTAEQMLEQHGQSGRTRQQILDEYEAHRSRVVEAETFLNTMLAERGL